MAYEGPHPFPVPSGGTGEETFTQHGVLLGEGAAAIAATAVGTTNTVLLGQTGADPIFGAVPNAALANSTVTLLAGTGVSITGGNPLALGGTATISSSQTLNYTSVNHAASPYTVLTTDYYISVDTSMGSITLNFPNTPTANQTWIVKDRTGNASTNNITLTTPGGTVTFDGQTAFKLTANFESVSLIADSTPAYEVF